MFCVHCVFCGRDLFTGVCCISYFVTHCFCKCISHLFTFCMSISRMYLCDTFRLIPVCVQIITYFHFPTPHHQLPSCLWQSVLMLCKVRGDGGATGGMWETVESVKMVSVYLSLQNNTIRVTVSNKFYDSFEYISIMHLQSTA